jgi:hypothetical protein
MTFAGRGANGQDAPNLVTGAAAIEPLVRPKRDITS